MPVRGHEPGRGFKRTLNAYSLDFLLRNIKKDYGVSTLKLALAEIFRESIIKVIMLKDVLTANLNVVFCGTAKGKASAGLGYYYPGYLKNLLNLVMINELNSEKYELDEFIEKMKKYKAKFLAFISSRATSFVFGFKGVDYLNI